MEAYLKPIVALAAVLISCGLLAACALPSPGVITSVVQAPEADTAAIKVEVVLAALAGSFSTVVADPDAKLDRARLTRQVDKATAVLDRARSVFDARRGGVSGLVSEALGLVSDALPADASLTARFALSTAFAGVRLYAAGLDVAGDPVAPSAALIDARVRADEALADLRAQLPPPGS